jgi:hypothetical protein
MTTVRKITAMIALTTAMIVAEQASASFGTVVHRQMVPAASYQIADGDDDGAGGLLGGTGILGDWGGNG